ncbi:MAG: hypothetical protein IAF02_16415 [Anaerolineae bacterium]|nr:hypothetical protein [Anaerolineae bacterium]
MELTPQSKLSKALTLHADVLPYIISLNPHDFERLNNPLMRQLMPPRITWLAWQKWWENRLMKSSRESTTRPT